MNPRDPFLNLSSLDHRYWAANRELFENLSETLSERGAVSYQVQAEVSLLKAHIRLRLGGKKEFLQAADALVENVLPEEVSAEEEITQHNIRALVNVIQRHLPEELAPYVHLGATSVDILDTSMAMRVRDSLRNTILPVLLNLLEALIKLSRNEAETAQAGRTHGQLAVPITFGYAVSEYVSRLGQSIREIHNRSGRLRGKLSGAVGACNATSLITSDPEKLEKEYLEELGLSPADYANQIVEPEHMLRLLLEINVAFGIIANLADDFRHLQRTEIAEISENFSAGQVGSSTMPQKKNPWNSEHVKSLWKAFSPRVTTFFMDQISEHQRDLTNSASGRFLTDYLAGFAAAAARMLRVIQGVEVNREKMRENLHSLGDGLMAEPTYIILALSGYSDAHEIVRRAALRAREKDEALVDVLDSEFSEAWEAISVYLRKSGIDSKVFYRDPAAYRGLSVKKTHDLANTFESMLQKIREDLDSSEHKRGA